jgi:glutamine amidotransferase
MIGIIDYGVGNLFSLKSSFKYIGVSADLVSDEKGIRACEKLILPGVGAFGDAADALKKSGLDSVIKAVASEGKPLMGICLGMQLLFEKGLEFGEHDGLGLIPGTVVPIKPLIKDNKIPHIGWNKLEFTEQRGDIYKYTADGDFVYFVHSYHAECPDEFVTARTEYGSMLTASVQKGNVMGAQYHPEKSGDTGLMILKSFCEF